jgi:hypothetical protein
MIQGGSDFIGDYFEVHLMISKNEDKKNLICQWDSEEI